MQHSRVKIPVSTPIRHFHKGRYEANMHPGIFWLIKVLKISTGLCKTKITPIVDSNGRDVFGLLYLWTYYLKLYSSYLIPAADSALIRTWMAQIFKLLLV